MGLVAVALTLALSTGTVGVGPWTFGSLVVIGATMVLSGTGFHDVSSASLTYTAVLATAPVASSAMRTAVLAFATIAALALLGLHIKNQRQRRLELKRTLLSAFLIVAGLLPLATVQTSGSAAAALLSTIIAAAILYRFPAEGPLKAGVTILIPCIALIAIDRSEIANRLGFAAFLCLLGGAVLALNESFETRILDEGPAV